VSLRLEAAIEIAAPVERVWEVLVDWPGQARWVPLTTVRTTSAHAAGLGVRVVAMSGFQLGRIPVGILDRFIVTGWTPPAGPRSEAELEVLHLGPSFTGEGVFRLQGLGAGTMVRCLEQFQLLLAPLTEPVARLALPLLRAGLMLSLRRLAEVCEGPS
jgi:uncharacterized protein YndB with AHSA1/START domain